MFRAVPLKKIMVCLLMRDVDRVTEALGRLHVLHLTQVPMEDVDLPVTPINIEEELLGCRHLLDQCRILAGRLGVRIAEISADGEIIGAGDDEGEQLDRNMIEGLLNRIGYENKALFKESDLIRNQIERATEIIEEVEPYIELNVQIEQLDKFSFLHFAVGTVPEANLPDLFTDLGPSSVVVPLGAKVETDDEDQPRRSVIAITNKAGRWALETALMENNFEATGASDALQGVPSEVHKRMLAERTAQEEKKAQIAEKLRHVAEKYDEMLGRAYERLLIEEQILNAKANFGRTGSTVLISGWLPVRQVEEVSRAILDATNRRAIIEFQDGKELLKKGEEIPVLTENPRWLKPFEQLVTAYGHPRYEEIEPTLFATVSFLVMFGLMFGDLGHGLMLATVGWLVRKYTKARAMRDFGYIVMGAGLSAALFGLFFQGSVFGLGLSEMGFPLTLGFEPLGRGGRNVTPYLGVTIGFGIFIITFGLILNIVNRLRTGDFEHGFMDRFGVAGFIFYWGALGLGIKLTLFGSGKYDTWLIVFLIVLPLFLICFREPIFSLLTHRRKLWKDGAGMGLMTGFIETYETISSYLANTMSFARVGAFALSHAGLCFTIYEFEKMAQSLPGRTLWSILILVVGHLFVVALEGFIVFIQIIRLEYYEFFGKFFRADGKAFQAFRVGPGVPRKSRQKP